jgi:hypothetical protein
MHAWQESTIVAPLSDQRQHVFSTYACRPASEPKPRYLINAWFAIVRSLFLLQSQTLPQPKAVVHVKFLEAHRKVTCHHVR